MRKASWRTLIVVNTETRGIVAERIENMNGGCSCAKITKPIYELCKSGKGIMFYAHTPHLLRIPAEINGRYFAKPPNWKGGRYFAKPPNWKGVPAPKAPVVVAPTTNVRRIYHSTGYGDGTAYVEYDGT